MSFRPYGMLVALGLLVAYLLGRWRLKRYHVAPYDFDAAFFWSVIGGIVGARLYHVLDYWTYYATHPEKMIAVWEGGIGIFGALIGGFLALSIWARRHKPPLLTMLALAAPGLLLGQAIGRMGNFVNQEGFGPPTGLPWGVFIDPMHRPAQWMEQTRFHPTFFYEAAWLAAGGLLLLFLERRDIIQRRSVVGFYLVWFGIGRFFIELLRWDTMEVGGIKVAHIFALICVLIGAFLLVKKRFKIQK